MAQEHEQSERESQLKVEQIRNRLGQVTLASEGSDFDEPSVARLAGFGRYFTPDPVKSGVEHYRLRDSGYSVWTVVGALRAADGDVHAVAETYGIPETDIHTCIGLLLRHPLPILGRITDEEDAEVVPSKPE
jgi:hypothetical protein